MATELEEYLSDDNVKPKRRRASSEALQLLVEEVEKNPYLIRGRCSGIEGRRQWNLLTYRLNQLTRGKTPEGWRQSWKNLVRRVRKKAFLAAAPTDLGYPSQRPLADYEERVLEILGAKLSMVLDGKTLGKGKPPRDSVSEVPSTSNGVPRDSLSSVPRSNAPSTSSDFFGEEVSLSSELSEMVASPKPLLRQSPKPAAPSRESRTCKPPRQQTRYGHRELDPELQYVAPTTTTPSPSPESPEITTPRKKRKRGDSDSEEEFLIEDEATEIISALRDNTAAVDRMERAITSVANAIESGLMAVADALRRN